FQGRARRRQGLGLRRRAAARDRRRLPFRQGSVAVVARHIHGAGGHAFDRDRAARRRALDRGSGGDGSSRSMKFRTRLLISFGVVVMIPLLVFGLGIRREMSNRVTGEYERRVSALVNVINADLAGENDRIAGRLAAMKRSLASDNKFRALVLRGDEREYVL